MKKRKNLIIILSIAAVFAILIFVRFTTKEDVQRGAPTPVVVVGHPTKGEIVNNISLTGDILPVQQANVYSKVNGNIEKIFVNIGDNVKQGQVLAVIDTTIYAQNVRQAQANFLQADVNFKNNKANYLRSQKLYEQKLIARQDLETAQTTMESSGAQREAANANYQNALTQMSYCRVTAPFSGIITKRFFDPGAYITTGGANPSSTLFVLMNGTQVKTMINIPENYVPQVNHVQGVEVIADALPGKVYKAKINKMAESIDLSTRTMAAEILIDNDDKQLTPGMFATINLILEKKENSIVLPNQVLLNDDKGDYVYSVKPDSTVFKKYVKVGIRKSVQSEVVSGLDTTEQIVVVGQNLLRDKAKVKITKQ